MAPNIARPQDVAESLMLAKRGDELGRTIFFIGAGCSVSAGIPTAPEIARRMVVDLCSRFGLARDGISPSEAYRALVNRGRLDVCGKDAGADGSAKPTAGKNDEAHYQLGESLDLFRKLATLNQTSADAQRDYTIALERMAEITAEIGDRSAAISLYRQSLPIARKLAQAHPENPQLQQDLAITERSLAKLEQSDGGVEPE